MSKQPAKPAKRPDLSEIDKWMHAEESKPRRGRCYGCSHPDREAIDAASLHFLKRRKDGATSLAWGTFFASYIRKHYPSFTSSANCLLGHMERCRGAKLK